MQPTDRSANGSGPATNSGGRPAPPRHPTGRAKRRWPRAYDGGSTEPPINRRYARDYEGDLLVERRRTSRSRSLMADLRQSPIRNGLIGLAVAGTAAPIAINRYQQALRTDPNHEHMMASAIEGKTPMSDSSVSGEWRSMESERAGAEATREAVIVAQMEENAAFGLSRELAEDIYDMALAADVEPEVAFGLVRAESSFKNQATSRVGAVGLTQLMPSTARWLEPGITRDDLRDTQTNLRIGFGYLRDLIDKYNGNEDLALTAYNRGPGTVDRILKRGGNADNGYSKFVKTGKVGNHRG